jgi:hypothetical protein
MTIKENNLMFLIWFIFFITNIFRPCYILSSQIVVEKVCLG